MAERGESLMPTLELSISDMEGLLGQKLPRDKEKLNDILQYSKCEVESFGGEILILSSEDGNRPDLWCVEGIARELKGVLGIETGMKNYKVNDSNLKIIVDTQLKNIRPFIACAAIKNVKLTDDLIKQLMQQQDKIDSTYGRKRKKTSIGIYDFDLIKFPLRYTLTSPEENAFVPLGFEIKLNPKQILEQHPKGVEYGHLIKSLEKYPIFLDAKSQVLSMPPIINSNNLGKITEATKNIFIEVTGTDWNSVHHALVIMALSLVDRGGDIFGVNIDSPFAKKKLTPDMSAEKMLLEVSAVKKLIGIDLSLKEIEELLGKMRYGIAKKTKEKIEVKIPAYRNDIMHPVDLAEDVAIAYGYDKIPPYMIGLPTVGDLSSLEKFSDKVRELCIGLGMQEVLTFSLTNKNNLFEKMFTQGDGIELENPVSSELTLLRSWLLPSLLDFLANNKHREYPQRIFEVGDCVVLDGTETGTRTVRKLTGAICYDSVNLTEGRSNIEALMKNLGCKFEIKPYSHPSFIETRSGEILVGNERVGFFGEIHPKVLEAWQLEKPVIAFEIDIEKLM